MKGKCITISTIKSFTLCKDIEGTVRHCLKEGVKNIHVIRKTKGANHVELKMAHSLLSVVQLSKERGFVAFNLL